MNREKQGLTRARLWAIATAAVSAGGAAMVTGQVFMGSLAILAGAVLGWAGTHLPPGGR